MAFHSIKVEEPNGTHPNGLHVDTDAPMDLDEFSQFDLERELPKVLDGQVPLGDLVSRVVQQIYAELVELADTMPSYSDPMRKRTLAEWVVKTKKNVVKLYAVAKWARDAETVQKCMNITSFLMGQRAQFDNAIAALNNIKEGLNVARLRNHDILTSLDVLTTGNYQRLPTVIKKYIIQDDPLTDAQVEKTLRDTEDVIRYRLRMSEVIPIEMADYCICDGRVFFTVPGRFKASICLTGALAIDGWFFVHAEFLFGIGGDSTSTQDFPREPTGVPKRFLVTEADSRLQHYLPPPPNQVVPPGVEVPPRPQLPEGTVDAPLVRLFNFLQMMSLSYQLEILWFQAERMRSLGWAEYLRVNMNPDRKGFTASYWIRKPPANRPPPGRPQLPLLGGTLSIHIVDLGSGGGPKRSATTRVLAELAERAKLGDARPSDAVENMSFQVKWEPMKGAMSALVPPEDASCELLIHSDNLDFETLLREVIRKHVGSVLRFYQAQQQRAGHACGEVSYVEQDGEASLHVHLCADEVVVITIDPRTGRLSMRDTGDLAAAGRGPRFSTISAKLNESPEMLYEALARLRLQTIVELAEQKANYLGLHSFRRRNLPNEELAKLGPSVRGMLYIQLTGTTPPTGERDHYLLLVVTDEEFRYALLETQAMPDTTYRNAVINDIAWLDVKRIHGGEVQITPVDSLGALKSNANDPGPSTSNRSKFDLETSLLRELYAYCCARVAYVTVEKQFKARGIPYHYFSQTMDTPDFDGLVQMQSRLARSIPALCVQSWDILSGAPAAEAAMRNIRVIPVNWWSGGKTQVVTCVKLKYVQQPVGKTAGTSTVIRLSKRIIYDTTQAVVSFLSADVERCVDDFVEEWARVSKMVVIAREVAQMASEHHWDDVRLLSFDLTNVEFTYSGDYTLSITCKDQLSLQGGTYDLRFGHVSAMAEDDMSVNPHDDAESFMCQILRHGKLAPSLHRLVELLRHTLPIVLLLRDMQAAATKASITIDAFPKSAAWYRVLFGDFRHALDFRLLRGERVVILDGSHSLFQSKEQMSNAKPASSQNPVGLQPIPGFRQLILDAVRDVGASVPGKLAPIDVGVVCDATATGAVGKAVYERLLAVLKDTQSKS